MNHNKPRIGFIATAKVNHQKDEVRKMLTFYQEYFTAREDVDAVFEEEVLFRETDIAEAAVKMEKQDVDAIVFIVGTWIFSSHIISAAQMIHTPFVLYGLSDTIANGNFGASLQIRYVLQEMGKKFLYLYGTIHNEENLKKILQYGRAAWVKKQVQNKKIATIGGKCMMMYQTQVNEFSWKNTFGIDFPQYDAVQVFTEMKNISDEEAKPIAEAFAKQFDRVVWKNPNGEDHIADDAILSQTKMFLAFKKLKEMYGIEVFANKCMPEMASAIYGYKYAACVATCMLNEAGILTACEADIPAAFSMLLLSRVSGGKVFFADIARLSEDHKRLTFFNCGTAPVSLADRSQPVELWPTPDATADEGVADRYMTGGADKQRGACVRFDLKNGEKATILRVGGNGETLRFHVATAKTCKREVDPNEALGQRWPGFGLEFEGNIDEFLQNTVGHHYVLAFGDWTQELHYLADIFNVRYVGYDGYKAN